MCFLKPLCQPDLMNVSTPLGILCEHQIHVSICDIHSKQVQYCDHVLKQYSGSKKCPNVVSF